MFNRHHTSEPIVNPVTIARVLGALNTIGRPLTYGELRMYHGLSRQKAVALRLALSYLVTSGRVTARTEHNERFNRECVTYGLAPKRPERGEAS